MVHVSSSPNQPESRTTYQVKVCPGEAAQPVAGREGREANGAPGEQPCVINGEPGPAVIISRLIDPRSGCCCCSARFTAEQGAPWNYSKTLLKPFLF